MTLHEREDSRVVVDRIAQVVAIMEAHDCGVPPVIQDVLRKAAEAGRVIGTA